MKDDTRKKEEDTGEEHLIATYPVFVISFGVDSAEEKTLLGSDRIKFTSTILSWIVWIL